MTGAVSVKELGALFSSELYFRALSVHRTHKNERLVIPKDGFLYTIYMDDNDFMVIIKSTQTGISEYLTVKALTKAEKGRGVLYVLPTDLLKGTFVKERIDKPLTFSQYYRDMIKDTPVKRYSESVTLKQIKSGSLLLAGSNSPNSFISYPADDIIIDEYDACNQANLNMAEERQSASQHKTTTYVGNPSISGFGLDIVIQETDEKEWHLRCPNCGRKIQPDFFKHVVMQVEEDNWLIRDTAYDPELGHDIRPICEHCNKPYNRKDPGEWVAKRNSHKSGYRVSKMFSTFVTVEELIARFNRGLVDDKAMERFYNGDLGLAYKPEGSKIFPYMLDACMRDYSMPDHSRDVCVLGCDVGKLLHVTIAKLLPNDKFQTLYIGYVVDEEQVTELYRRFRCRVGVIDGLPESRMSKRLCGKHKGMFRWFKANEKTSKVDPKTKIVSANRTELLDDVKLNVLTNKLLLPRNARSIPDFYDQVCAPTRLYDEEKLVYYWDEGSQADHYCFSLAFMVLAKKILAMVGK